jgi:hypothetical protein
MTYATTFKNESYLAITSIISIGVLSGLQYCSPLLGILLIAPLLRVWLNKIMCKQQIHFSNSALNKYIACK